MHIIHLPIDTKSLYMNILNDNLKGHTCTVATPIKQGNSVNKYLEQVYKIPCQIDYHRFGDLLETLINKSKTAARVNNVFVFDSIKVNGTPIQTDSSFCFFTKEEMDPSKAQYGRVKLHYPFSLAYEPLNIDNRKVMSAVSAFFHDFAFVVIGFDYSFDDNSLDFRALIVGYGGIPYSKVFINSKGVGSKYNNSIKNNIDKYDAEILAIRKKIKPEASTSDYLSITDESQIKAKRLAACYLESIGAKDIVDVSNNYPYSIYDIQYQLGETVFYAIVCWSYTRTEYIDLSLYQNAFIHSFPNSSVVLINDLEGGNIIKQFFSSEIDRFSAQINSVRFYR